MKTQNDKVSEEVRELVYSDYNNKYEQLKAELKEREKGCNCENNYKTGDKLKVCGKNWYCPTCQAKIEYLKKGISACEEILNQSQQKKTCGDTPTQQQECRGTNPEEGKVSKENDTTYSADTQTLIKQALSQRNQEILEILNKYKNTFCDLCEEDYQKLKKQLTNSEDLE